VPIELPSPPDASAKQILLQAIGVADAHGFGLSIRVALGRAGHAVLFVESLPLPDRRVDCATRDGSADEGPPPA